ncbi:AgmX/PglI C-terminal domain-containing protein [Sandaracinus amylolyticus]|uniref:AgmX/PglI C-terminal domain-containing protein n=1 Tax=Sandaracinus amylolyticus TaxID=927083 RepID=UPI001F21CF91|nr:AgmX/PglI C-terminal domain-containing protein [Sandaracinus amylolyticus]UJR79017.1 FHA/TonB domain protein [Sandaracinus amylolyticus]
MMQRAGGIAAIVLALSGCAGGNCPRRAASTGGNTAGSESTAVASQGPTAHETPEHNLEFDEQVVTASPSDAPPERLTPEIVQHVVTGQLTDVHQCYENALHATPGTAGRVAVLMHISATGNVVSTEVAENTTGVDTLGTCIAQHAQHWHFPEAAHDIAVRYPFSLQPAPQ